MLLKLILGNIKQFQRYIDDFMWGGRGIVYIVSVHCTQHKYSKNVTKKCMGSYGPLATPPPF